MTQHLAEIDRWPGENCERLQLAGQGLNNAGGAAARRAVIHARVSAFVPAIATPAAPASVTGRRPSRMHDQSAPVGLDYVVDNQARIGELIFLNGFYAPSPNLTPPKGIEIHDDPRLQAVEVAVETDPAAIEALHRFQMDEFIAKSPNEARVIDTLWSQFGEARPAFIAINDILQAEVGGRLATVDRLRTIEVPVDIVYGALDPYLTAELAREFDELLPNSTLTLVEDAGHYVQIDSPEVVAAAILNR
jgi:pimeloyl-ACP methyl ester carboxylesterase